MKKLLLSCMLATALSCGSRYGNVDAGPNFTKELEDLRTYFHIPGMAAIVTRGDAILYEHYFGYSDLENKIPVDSTTTFAMASLTKMFSGTLLRRAAANGSPAFLDRPINEYVENTGVGDSVLVKHVATHTSQGIVGKHFYYSFRYSWLTKVIEKEYGMPYEKALRTFLDQLPNTYLLTDSSHLQNIAKPYMFEGTTKPGFIDYGYSASAGIASTVRDLAKFSKVIANDFKPDGLYGYGLFSQVTQGYRILWAYGQYDCYSSLFIMIPEKDFTLVLAANNNLMSDPARLIYGDVTNSMFALSFLKHFASEKQKEGRSANELALKSLKAQALAESFLARYDTTRANLSKNILQVIFRSYSTDEYAELGMMHNIMFLKEIRNFSDFDKELKDIGGKLLEADIANPYANYYLGRFYELQANDSAGLYYSRIVNSKNFDVHWYTREARSWLESHPGF